MTIYTVHHSTTYAYWRPVAFGEHRMMLRPRDSRDQRLLRSELDIAPNPASLSWERDGFGNWVGVARFAGRARELRFDSTVTVDHAPACPDGLQVEASARSWPAAFRAGDDPDLRPYLTRRAGQSRSVDDWVRRFLPAAGSGSTLGLLTTMNAAIRAGFSYVRRVEQGIQEPAHTLQTGRGTCRDFTVLMMDAVRSLGLPARFVSGYLYVPSRDRRDLHGGGSTHAWLQVYLPGPGWIDLDPTNAIVGNDGLIRVAVVAEPHQAVPLHGSYTGFPSDDLGMTVTVRVARNRGRPDGGREESERGQGERGESERGNRARAGADASACW